MTTRAPLCFIDTETTGVHPDRRPWEIAVIRRDYLGVYPDGRPAVEERTLLVQVADVDLSLADPFALKIGGFYERHRQYEHTAVRTGTYAPPSPEQAREAAAAAAAKARAISEPAAAVQVEQLTRGAHLVGTNPAFDAETLDRMFRRHQLIPAWDYHLVDVSAMALGYLNGVVRGAVPERQARMADLSGLGVTDLPPMPALPEPIVPPWKSDELGRLLGVEPASDEERHTALGDARWAMRMYDAMVGGAR